MQRDPYKFFRIEARELLEQLGKAALDLEAGGAPADSLARLLRLAHTMKGAARVVKQGEMADRAHAIEDALAPCRDGRTVPRETIDAALKLIDEMGDLLAQIPSSEAMQEKAAERPVPEKKAKTETPAGAPADSSGATGNVTTIVPEVARTVRTDVGDVDLLLQGFSEVSGEITSIRAAIAELGQMCQGIADKSGGIDLERMMGTWERDVAASVDRAERELGELRALTERLRLIPAGALFNGLERLARDSARATGRAVEFEGRGGEVRLDGHVLDIVQPALMQMVRNAIAHGIEPEAERRAAQKPPAGRVTLEVARKGQRAVFHCRDDGGGVNFDALERALRLRGVLPAGSPRPDSAQLLRLLLKGGVSTATSVTDLSGRGIGLDVVREAAERLRGELTIDTEAGKGTTIALSVPLSLASFEALIVEASGASAALPLEAVIGVRRANRDELAIAAESEAIVHRDELVPLLRLSSHLGISAHERAPAGRRDAGAFTVILLNSGERSVAVAVDRLAGVEAVLYRPVPDLAPIAPIVAGLCLDADGNPRAVLAPEVLADLARRGSPRTEAAPAPRKPVLVIDDSLTTRMLEQSILESAGYTVELATSAEEGMEMAHRNDYALILCDVEMPGMDGFAFVERSRADPRLREVPCMLVTSRNSPADHRRAEEAGANGYIVKGEFDQGHFLARVAQLANR
ncbi:MAG TPA: response regulator [Burkholderiales bacterium]|nr:response regulator [Burkholderiales bacterium]